jgi:hypothetical protein
MTSCNLNATYQRFGGAQRLWAVQHSSALRRPHAPRNADKSVPDYTVAVAKNTVIFKFLSLVTLTVKFSTNIIIVLGGITYEIYCRWHVKLIGLAQIYFTIKYLLLIQKCFTLIFSCVLQEARITTRKCRNAEVAIE